MELEDDELYLIEGRQLEELFNCVLCKTKLKKLLQKEIQEKTVMNDQKTH